MTESLIMLRRSIVDEPSSAPIAVLASQIKSMPTDCVDASELVRNLAVILSNKCLARCAHCYNDSGPSGKHELKMEQVFSFVDWWRRHTQRIQSVGLSGGEPFLYRELPYLIEGLHRRQLEVSITTGGVGVDLNLVRECSALGVNRIKISWDRFHNEFLSERRLKELVLAAVDSAAGVTLGLLYTTGEEKARLIEWADNWLPATVDIVCSPTFGAGRGKSLVFSKTLSVGRVGVIDYHDTCTLNYDGRMFASCDVNGFSEREYLGELKSELGVGNPSSCYRGRLGFPREQATLCRV